jgi:hypothetical protein
MFYAQCDNIGSMYKLAVKVIDTLTVHAQVTICIHMESIFILQPCVFWIIGMSNKAKCDTL